MYHMQGLHGLTASSQLWWSHYGHLFQRWLYFLSLESSNTSLSNSTEGKIRSSLNSRSFGQSQWKLRAGREGKIPATSWASQALCLYHLNESHASLLNWRVQPGSFASEKGWVAHNEKCKTHRPPCLRACGFVPCPPTLQLAYIHEVL